MDRPEAERPPSPSSPLLLFASPAACRLADFFNSELFSDLTLVLGDRHVHAHRIIVATHVPALAARFEAAATTQTIRIDDVDPDIFNELLRFAYTGNIKLPAARYEELLVAASNAGMWDLVGICGDRLWQQVNRGNALRLFRLARLHGAVTLESLILEFVAKNAAAIRQTEEFQQLDAVELRDLFGALVDFPAR